jgi:hypothetical protein
VALKLLEDGTLEGDVTLEYTGQIAAQRRERDFDDAPSERERAFTEDFVKRLPGAELTAFAFENADNPEAPYTIRFKLRAPGYGQRTGSRMFVQPAVIQRGAAALFTASTRQHRVYFPYTWTEQDTVTIDLPEGYEVEPDASPEPLALNGGALGVYFAKVAVSPETRRATYTRTFSFGGRGSILFQAADYNTLKTFFGGVDRNDGHTLALRRRAASDAR